MRELWIDGTRVADDEPCYVVAELGGTHGGAIETATDLIRVAAEGGAHAVKFQKRDVERLYAHALLGQSYDNEISYGATYGAHRHALEFNEAQYVALQQVALARGITCFATAFDETSADLLMALEMPAIKIHSGGLTDEALLRHVARCGVPILLSTGGGTLAAIDQAVDWLSTTPHALLHCTAAYPLLPAEANLRMVLTLRSRYPATVIGFSSHSPGLACSLVAYAFGARIIEHHVTLSRAGKGTDHGFALEPKGLQTLCEDLRMLQMALGDGVKRIYPSEQAPLAKMRRQITPEGLRITGLT